MAGCVPFVGGGVCLVGTQAVQLPLVSRATPYSFGFFSASSLFILDHARYTCICIYDHAMLRESLEPPHLTCCKTEPIFSFSHQLVSLSSLFMPARDASIVTLSHQRLWHAILFIHQLFNSRISKYLLHFLCFLSRFLLAFIKSLSYLVYLVVVFF